MPEKQYVTINFDDVFIKNLYDIFLKYNFVYIEAYQYDCYETMFEFKYHVNNIDATICDASDGAGQIWINNNNNNDEHVIHYFDQVFTNEDLNTFLEKYLKTV